MNTERIRRLADLIELLPEVDPDLDEPPEEFGGKMSSEPLPDRWQLFDMRDMLQQTVFAETGECRTIGCIAGYAYLQTMSDDGYDASSEDPDLDVMAIARNYLDLNESQAARLFGTQMDSDIALDGISAAMAATVLRGLADKLRIDWKEAIEKCRTTS